MTPDLISRKKSIEKAKTRHLVKVPPEETVTCKECEAIYHNMRWSLSRKTAEKAAQKRLARMLCPHVRK